MKRLLASLVVSTPLLLGSALLFASTNTASNHPIYPIYPTSLVNDKSVNGVQYAYHRHHRYHKHHRHHRPYYRYHHRRCWIGHDGFRYCRRW